MAWTAPMTFTANTVLTAAQMNTHVRDNLLETAPAKATVEGGYFASVGANQIVERNPGLALVGTQETTNSDSYTDLATVGPEITVETGRMAIVFISCLLRNNTGGAVVFMSHEVSGASSRVPSDSRAVANGVSVGASTGASHAMVWDELTPGTNTFTAKYRVADSAEEGDFRHRRMLVLPY